MTYIKIAAIIYVCTYLLFIHYAAIMRLRDLRDAGLLTKEAAFFGYQGLGVGYLARTRNAEIAWRKDWAVHSMAIQTAKTARKDHWGALSGQR